jgi:hypothetical protein
VGPRQRTDFWRKEKSLVPSEIRTLVLPVSSPVTIPTEVAGHPYVTYTSVCQWVENDLW